MTDDIDLDDLVKRLNQGPGALAEQRPLPPAPLPLYLLSVDDPGPRSIVLIVRTGDDGVTRGKIMLPEWQELPAGWDGPHLMDVAIPLANGYADAYGYSAIMIDIESSQLWDHAWGDLII